MPRSKESEQEITPVLIKKELTGLSPVLAYFLFVLTNNPELIQIDAEAGGLTIKGTDYYKQELIQLISNALKKVRNNKTLLKKAEEYQQTDLSLSDGTESISLQPTEREAFFQFLANEGAELSDFQKKIILTSIII